MARIGNLKDNITENIMPIIGIMLAILSIVIYVNIRYQYPWFNTNSNIWLEWFQEMRPKIIETISKTRKLNNNCIESPIVIVWSDNLGLLEGNFSKGMNRKKIIQSNYLAVSPNIVRSIVWLEKIIRYERTGYKRKLTNIEVLKHYGTLKVKIINLQTFSVTGTNSWDCAWIPGAKDWGAAEKSAWGETLTKMEGWIESLLLQQ